MGTVVGMRKAGGRATRSALPRVRTGISAAVLLTLLAGALLAGTPLVEAAAYNITLCQLLPALLRLRAGIVAGAGIALLVFPALVGLTLLFGRVYCSTLCPLGALQDLVLFLRRRTTGIRLRFRRPRHLLRAVFVVAALGPWLLGSSVLLVLLDPYAIVERPLSAFAVSLAGGSATTPSLASLPAAGATLPAAGELVPGGATGTAFLLSAALLVAVLAAAALKGRIFCNTLCPAGTLLAPVARRSFLRVRLAPDLCTSCGLCERVCSPRCIDSEHKRVYEGSCVLCLNCLPACPNGALTYRWSRP